MLTVWDEPKRLSNLEVHGLDFADVQDRFDWATAQITVSHPGADGHQRFVATGFLGRRLATLVFAPLGTEAIALISLRAASRSERRRFAET